MRETTDHLQQIQRAIDFIESNLREELETETIARRAGYSHWHFQRLFTATVGESVKEYVRKRRLTHALGDLAGSKRRILEIALDYGFESQEAFSRAFKARFLRTPGAARKAGMKFVISLDKPKITMAYLDHLYRGINMQPKIENFPERKIVGMGASFISILSPDKTNHTVIPALWGKYLPRAGEIQGRKSWTDLGLIYCLENGKPGECYYIAGTEVSNGTDPVPAGMEARVIPAGTYAVFTHKGSLDKLGHTMNYIYGSWLPKSGRKFRNAPDVEIYDKRFNPSSPDSELDICIPVE